MKKLDEIRVIDLTQAWAGPYGTMMLGFLGADVIKVEPPHGDHFRFLTDGSFFAAGNLNKESISIELKDDRGQEILYDLVGDADVFVENFRPGVTERLGCDYDKISEINEDIVYCSLSGFGESGPYRDYPAYDPVGQAMSGIMHKTGFPDRPPVRVGTSVVDSLAGLLSAFSIMESLYLREKTGEGQKIEVSMLDAATSVMSYWMAYYTLTGDKPQRQGSQFQGIAPYQVYETKDDYILLAVLNKRQWEEFCKAMDLEELLEDKRFSDRDTRWENREELNAILEKEFAKYTRDEVVEKLIGKTPCAPIKSIDELVEDPHMKERGKIVETVRPEDGKEGKTVGVPFDLSNTDSEVTRVPPEMGEHTKEILDEVGYTEEKIKKLADEGVINGPI